MEIFAEEIRVYFVSIAVTVTPSLLGSSLSPFSLSIFSLTRALARKGSALQKQKNYDDVIAAFKSSLMEHRVADTLNKLTAVYSSSPTFLYI